ncbi:ATP-binding protein [Pseudodesulfovibrio indicus]|uniref:ATP-binding protein n=1 Tax=Pseudodesulfovibrio indicus TaxID=1716143 RepID=UPI00292D736D|nr:ATP-binding protein [Pseudodesulfovibrio indicus]
MTRRAVTFRIKATLSRLPAAQAFARNEIQRHCVTDAILNRLELVCEELFANVANHAYPDGTGEVELSCVTGRDGAGNSYFCLRVRDWGLPFNPLSAPAPDLEADLDGRPEGGLGVLLVKRMADNCHYRREDGANEFRACFKI